MKVYVTVGTANVYFVQGTVVVSSWFISFKPYNSFRKLGLFILFHVYKGFASISVDMHTRWVACSALRGHKRVLGLLDLWYRKLKEGHVGAGT